MIYVLKDTSKVSALFEGWEDTMIWSCLQQVMGRIYVIDENRPQSALACLGSFGFCAGMPDRELLEGVPADCRVLTPQNSRWNELIEKVFPQCEKTVRYAIRKDTVFDAARLQQMADSLPEGYEMREIDDEIYDQLADHPLMSDFVSCFDSRQSYFELGLGFVIMKDGRVVSGASSYSRYREGIEIEVDTVESERRKHLAEACCARLILECLNRGLYPSWDAQNTGSVRLAEKLGYRFSHEYTIYEI